MQVRSIQSPNFGMALKINAGAKDKIIERGEEYLNQLRKAGEELVDKKVDVEILDDLTPRVVTKYADKYRGPFKAELPKDEFLTVRTVYDGTNADKIKIGTWNAVYALGSKEAAIDAYKNLCAAQNDLEAATEFAKVIDKSIALKEAKMQAELEQKNKCIKIAEELLAKYGI